MNDYSTRTHPEILALLAAKDEGAWSYFVPAYRRWVCLHVKAAGQGALTPEDIEEVSQDVFLHLFKYAEQLYRDESSWTLGAMLKRFSRQAVARHFEQKNRKFRREGIMVSLSDTFDTGDGELPRIELRDTRISQHDLVSINQLLEKIPQNLSPIIQSHFFDEKSITALASAEGVTRLAISRRINQAVHILRSETLGKKKSSPAEAKIVPVVPVPVRFKPTVYIPAVLPWRKNPVQLVLPDFPVPEPPRLIKTLAEVERDAILDAVQKLKSPEMAAAALGISKTTLYVKLQEYRRDNKTELAKQAESKPQTLRTSTFAVCASVSAVMTDAMNVFQKIQKVALP